MLNKQQLISQIHVFETCNKLNITNTQSFTLKELKKHLLKINKLWQKKK